MFFSFIFFVCICFPVLELDLGSLVCYASVVPRPDVLFWCVFETGLNCTVQLGLRLAAILPQLPKSWEYKSGPPHVTSFTLSLKSLMEPGIKVMTPLCFRCYNYSQAPNPAKSEIRLSVIPRIYSTLLSVTIFKPSVFYWDRVSWLRLASNFARTLKLSCFSFQIIVMYHVTVSKQLILWSVESFQWGRFLIYLVDNTFCCCSYLLVRFLQNVW